MDRLFGIFLALITPVCISYLYIHWMERWEGKIIFPKPIHSSLAAALWWPCFLGRAILQVWRQFTRGGLANVTTIEVWGIILSWVIFGGLATTLIFGIREVELSLAVLVGVTLVWYGVVKVILGRLNRIAAQ